LNIDKEYFLSEGIDIANPRSLVGIRRFEVETPVRIGAFEPQLEFKIGAYSYIHDGIYNRVTIGRYCSIGRNLVCLQPNHPLDWVSTHPFQYLNLDNIISENAIKASSFNAQQKDFKKLEKPIPSKKGIIIENDVWIGTNVTILSGVTIGNGAVVGAGSVVTKNIEPYSVVAGNPAKKVKSRFDEGTINKLLHLEWWKYDIRDESLPYDDIALFIEKIQKLIESEKINLLKPKVVTQDNLGKKR
jgi:acetyltransferase-like isoleucine patch superfamily enzyme